MNRPHSDMVNANGKELYIKRKLYLELGATYSNERKVAHYYCLTDDTVLHFPIHPNGEYFIEGVKIGYYTKKPISTAALRQFDTTEIKKEWSRHYLIKPKTTLRIFRDYGNGYLLVRMDNEITYNVRTDHLHLMNQPKLF